MDTEKKVCLLTGAGGTLGSVFCRMFADKYHIVAVVRQSHPSVPSQNQTLVDPLRPSVPLPENSHSVYEVRADLGVDHEIARVVDIALARFGRIDLLVNAAVYSVWSDMVESNRLLESMEAQFRINTMLPMKLAVMISNKFWRNRDQDNLRYNRGVINISSTAGLYIYPDQGQSVYSASKAALNYLTYHMAAEFRPFGVRVNAIAPNSFPHIVTVEDVASAISRMDQSDITGKILILDADGEQWL